MVARRLGGVIESGKGWVKGGGGGISPGQSKMNVGDQGCCSHERWRKLYCKGGRRRDAVDEGQRSRLV